MPAVAAVVTVLSTRQYPGHGPSALRQCDGDLRSYGAHYKWCLGLSPSPWRKCLGSCIAADGGEIGGEARRVPFGLSKHGDAASVEHRDRKRKRCEWMEEVCGEMCKLHMKYHSSNRNANIRQVGVGLNVYYCKMMK